MSHTRTAPAAQSGTTPPTAPKSTRDSKPMRWSFFHSAIITVQAVQCAVARVERHRRVEILQDHRLTVIHPGEGAARVWSVHRVAGHELGWTARSAQKFMNAAKVFGKNESRNPQAFGTQDT